MTRFILTALLSTAAFGLALPLLDAEDTSVEQGREFFEAKIRPVLARSCYACNSKASGVPVGGLLLDSRDTIR